MSRLLVTPGDRVYSIEDRPVGTVTSIVGEYFKMSCVEGGELRLPMEDIYTADHHRVVMMSSFETLRGKFAPPEIAKVNHGL